MDSQTFRLGFVGAGKLAGSVIRGLVRAKFCPPDEIIASEPNDSLRGTLRDELGIRVTAENAEVAEQAGVLFLGVKPGVVLSVVGEFPTDDKLVISLAAGVRMEAMESAANGRFLRAMTNIPSAICRAATALARGSRTTGEDIRRAREIFSALGAVVEVAEDQIDAVTGLAGSGPAFVYSVIEAFAEGGKKMGLDPKVALTLATQMVLGSAQFASESGISPDDLRRMVVTPGGTTAAGLAAMERFKTAEGLIAAVEAATKRGQEMARENS